MDAWTAIGTSFDPMLFGIVLAFLVAAGLLVMGVRSLLTSRDVIADRLGLAADMSLAPGAEGGGLSAGMARGLKPFARLAQPTNEEDLSEIRARLVRGGYRQRYSVQVFLATKTLLALALPLAFVALNTRFLFTTSLTTPVVVWLVMAGFLAPNFYLASVVRARQRIIEHSLPDAMDLLVTCVEAGLGLDSAISRVAGELELSAPVLSEELRIVLLELSAGLPRGEAFRRLADRTGLDDLRSLASTLTQADVFGTSIAQALRTQADWMRTRRMQRAEERAATVAVKMSVPLVFFILPSLIAVVMGPAAVRVYKTLLPSLGGGN